MPTFLPDFCRLDETGQLLIEACLASDLAHRYGTPLYVISETAVREQARKYRAALERYEGEGIVAYAGKALLHQAMCKLVESEGLSLDVVSGGELYTALEAGFPPERLFFHGNNKSRDELALALEAGVGRIVIDNLHEITLLSELGAGRGTEVLVRITPGVEAHTHHYIQTGQLDTKFGLDISTGDAARAIELLINNPQGPHLLGVHIHIGSQILTLEPYRLSVSRVFEFLDTMRRRFGFVASEVDMGGGLGIRHTGEETPPSVASYVGTVADVVSGVCRHLDYPIPTLIFEPGRSIVGEAGLTLYRVGATKELPGVRRFAAVDGGMADNMRPALYDAEYRAVIANRPSESALEGGTPLALVGKFCESGDVLIRNVDLGRLEPGDLVAVLSTGAYTYSMASNYNRVPRPAMVFVRGSRSAIVVQRERYSDLVQHDRLPEWMR